MSNFFKGSVTLNRCKLINFPPCPALACTVSACRFIGMQSVWVVLHNAFTFLEWFGHCPAMGYLLTRKLTVM